MFGNRGKRKIRKQVSYAEEMFEGDLIRVDFVTINLNVLIIKKNNPNYYPTKNPTAIYLCW